MKILILICAMFMGSLVQAQMTGNPDSVYADGPRDPQNPANPPSTGAYFDWGRGRDGTGYCYQFTIHGDVLNGGMPVAENSCEALRPSKSDWARGRNGYGYCYQFTPEKLVMYQGRPQANEICEKVLPSHFAWGRGMDGWTYCFQYTPSHILMNEGRNVPNEKCY